MKEMRTDKGKNTTVLKWIFWLSGATLICVGLIISSIIYSKANEGQYPREIPNVFGMNYEDAVKILKDGGFKVNAMEVKGEEVYDGIYAGYIPTLEKGDVCVMDSYVMSDGKRIVCNGKFLEKEDVMTTSDNKIIIQYVRNSYDEDVHDE